MAIIYHLAQVEVSNEIQRTAMVGC